MSGFPYIMNAFTAFLKPGNAAVSTQCAELLGTAGENLMSIGLMSDIEDQFICRRIKNIM
ncbi:hypothetical protein SDC9_206468 [bioreactor metagenome]|uniref:Uncharacterized protein n=1 Tax=bioreactor metagenome TaxID=1076179 RepID=A0A645J4W8_9ZZZZ